jgi:putative ABC transport system permease protein
MRSVWQDIRYAIRLSGRAPAFTALAVVTLALGIGATTALFSVVHAVLLRPLPYDDPDRLVLVRARAADGTHRPALSGPEIADLRATGVFSQVGGLVAVDGNLTSTSGDVRMEQVPAANATDDFLPTLGVRPQIGRLLDARIDTGSGRILAVVISHELWQRRFGGDPAIVGSAIEVNNMDLTVVGILPPNFRVLMSPDANMPSQIDLWFSVRFDADRRDRSHATVARLAPGTSLEAARAALAVLAARSTAAHPDAYGSTPFVLSVDRLQDDTARPARGALLALMGAVTFVLLIACVNVANLLLARTAGRTRELSVRSAIGAARVRLLQQLVIEGLVLGMAGGGAGVLLSLWAETLVVWLRPPTLPAVHVNSLERVPLIFALTVTVLATVAFSLAPAMQAMRADAGPLLRASERLSSSTRARWLRALLMVVEVAVSVVLLVGAGLMLRTFVALSAVDPGFDSDRVLTLQASIHPRSFAEFEKKWQFYWSALDRLHALPGVQAVSAVRPLPFEPLSVTSRFLVSDSSREALAASYSTMPGYFSAMRIRLIEGRDFVRADIDQQQPVVVVDETFARRMWPNGGALGQELTLRRGSRDTRVGTVIGIVSAVRTASLAAEGLPQVYLPYHRNALFDMAIVIRTAGDPALLGAAAEETVESLGGRRPVSDVRPMRAYVSDALGESRFVLTLLGMFAAVAIVLCGIGLYGVMSHATAQRTREIGIRIALGATRRDILRLVVGEGLGFVVTGTVVGLVTAAAVTRVLQTMLFGVTPVDLSTLIAVSVLLVVVSLGACYAPARRATQVDAARSLNLP